MFWQHIKSIIITAVIPAVIFFISYQQAEAKLPSTIAVLPVNGDGQPDDMNELRVTFFDHIASKNYHDMEIKEVDSKLFLNEQQTGKKWQDLSTKELGELLGVEGLVYVDVLGIDKIYAGLYGSLTVRMRIKLVEADTGSVLWDKEDSVVKQSGSIPLSPWSAISTAVSSAMVLRDSVKIGLFDELCRSLAKQMPEPVNILALRPPTIFSVVTNALDSPFKEQSEILISLKGDEGMDAFFTIGTVKKGIPLQEVQPGTYLGKYIVTHDDNWDNQIINVYLTNSLKRKQSKYQVPYAVTADTTAPDKPEGIEASMSDNGIRLTWQKSKSTDTKEYLIQKATLANTQYKDVATTPINELIDNDTQAGQKIFYKIIAKDNAGNLSQPAEISKTMVKPGPTPVTGEINIDTTFYSYSSPYVVSGSLKVNKGVTLNIEDGTIIRFEDGSSMNIEGRVVAAGTDKNGITFKGKQYSLAFSDAGSQAGDFEHVSFRGGSSIEISNSAVIMNYSSMESFETGIKLLNNASLTTSNCKFSYNGAAVSALSGFFKSSDCYYIGNQTAINLTQDSTAELSRLTLNNNQNSVITVKPVQCDLADVGDSKSYEILKSLKGPVLIGTVMPFGQSLTALKADSANELTSKIAESLTGDKYDETDKLLRTMKELFSDRYDGMSALHAYVLYQKGMQAQAKDMLSTSVTPYTPVISKILGFTPSDGQQQQIKFVKIRIPIIGSGDGLGKTAVNKASKQAVRMFTDTATGELTREKNFEVNDKIISNSDNYTENAYPIFTNVAGNFFDGFYAVIIKPDKILNDLTENGIIGHKVRNIRIGIVSCGDENTVMDDLVKTLTTLMYPVSEYAAHGCNFADYKDEISSSSDILIMLKESFNVSQSRISKNMKTINANLNINIYEVKSGSTLLNAAKGETVFHINETMGKQESAKQAYDEIEPAVKAKISDLDKSFRPQASDAKQPQPKATQQTDPVLSVVSAETVYASMPYEFTSKPFMIVSIDNRTHANIVNANVTVDVPGYISATITEKVESIPSGGKVKVKLFATFNQSVYALKSNVKADAAITFKYQDKIVKATYPINILEPNSVKWTTKEKIALFTDKTDPAIARIASEISEKAAEAAKKTKLKKLYAGLFAFEYLSSYGIKYDSSRRNLFVSSAEQTTSDTVQYPSETLKSMKGGYADIYALYASILEACDINTSFTVIDGKLIALFDTGVPEEMLALAGDKKQKSVVYDENIWIPMEISFIGSGAIEAWNTGSKSAASIGKTVDMISLEKSSETYKNAGQSRANIKTVPASAFSAGYSKIKTYVTSK